MSSNLDPKNWTSRISQKPVEIGKDEFIQRGGLKNKDLLQVTKQGSLKYYHYTK
tara:strand:- start:3811 stop:3972 length:162 start_codon:yes stop_codon:yes gene_type:complete